jgi:hypothetical protein
MIILNNLARNYTTNKNILITNKIKKKKPNSNDILYSIKSKRNKTVKSNSKT